MGTYRTAEVCPNGHASTSSADTSPELREKYCSQCGEPTITQCPSCNANIRGYYDVPEVISILVTDEAARIAHRDNLSSEDRATLVLSALCYDLGKPATTEVTPHGIHSRGHPQAQEMYREFLQRLGTPI